MKTTTLKSAGAKNPVYSYKTIFVFTTFIASIFPHFLKATILLLNVLSINLILNKLFFSLFRSASNPVREARQFEGAQYNGGIGQLNNCATAGSCHTGNKQIYNGHVNTVHNCAATNSCHHGVRPVAIVAYGRKKRSITQAQTDSE